MNVQKKRLQKLDKSFPFSPSDFDETIETIADFGFGGPEVAPKTVDLGAELEDLARARQLLCDEEGVPSNADLIVYAEKKKGEFVLICPLQIFVSSC